MIGPALAIMGDVLIGYLVSVCTMRYMPMHNTATNSIFMTLTAVIMPDANTAVTQNDAMTPTLKTTL